MPWPNEKAISRGYVSAKTSAIDADRAQRLRPDQDLAGTHPVDGRPRERAEHDGREEVGEPDEADLGRFGVERERGVAPDRDEAGPRADLADRLAGQERPESGAERSEVGHPTTVAT